MMTTFPGLMILGILKIVGELDGGDEQGQFWGRLDCLPAILSSGHALARSLALCCRVSASWPSDVWQIWEPHAIERRLRADRAVIKLISALIESIELKS
jgi:hypothetical protein